MAEISSALEATILAVIDATEIRYGMKLIRLVDGEHTYRLEIDGEPPILFTDNADGEATDQLYAYVAQRKREERSKAVQAIIAAPELQSLRSQAGVSEEAEGVIDQILEAERYAPKIVPMGGYAPLFEGMQPDSDGPWLNRVDVAKRLRAALQGETK